MSDEQTGSTAMNIRKYDYSAMLPASEVIEWVTYADHVAEVERMRAACIAAVEAALLAKTEAVRQHYYEIGIDLESEGWLQWKSAMKTASQVADTALREVQP